jgi:hypothetical protein
VKNYEWIVFSKQNNFNSFDVKLYKKTNNIQRIKGKKQIYDFQIQMK